MLKAILDILLIFNYQLTLSLFDLVLFKKTYNRNIESEDKREERETSK